MQIGLAHSIRNDAVVVDLLDVLKHTTPFHVIE